MKKLLTLAFCCLGLTMQAQEPADSLPVTLQDSLLAVDSAATLAPTDEPPLMQARQTDEGWQLTIPKSLFGKRMLVTVRYVSTPGGTSTYGGEMATSNVVYWEKSPAKKIILRSEITVSVADTLDNIARAVAANSENPIIGAFDIAGENGESYTIKLGNFFLEDNAALGFTAWTKREFGVLSIMPQLSYIEGISCFPTNMEVKTVQTWVSAAAAQQPATYAGMRTGRVTFSMNVSFVLLPEAPMARRLFDPRVGYFSDRFSYLSDYDQQVRERRFVVRWRLEPKDSADAERMKCGELIEPKKPIVYYIDPATPKQWRQALIQGVNDWQVAFEAAGWKNAIMAKEWPENDSTMSLEDARYSVIRYLASDIANAYGPNVHDPRTGEIIESHIGWYHNVMTLLHDWYFVQAASLDEAARQMHLDEALMSELIRFVSSHEVGHTLGLRHNFGSSSTVPVDSLRSKAFVEAHGHTPSIMDYARFNYVAQPEDSIARAGIFPRIGDYDIWAIKWGYTPMFNAYDEESDHWELEKMTSEALASNRRLWFGDGETNRTKDSRCQTEDLGDDAVKASEYGILNLKRELRNLPAWTYSSNDIYNSNLATLWQQIYNQFLRYSLHVARNIGGLYADYGTVDQGGTAYTPVSRARQDSCMEFLDRNVFHEPVWLIDQSYVAHIQTDPKQTTKNLGSTILTNLTSAATLESLNRLYTAPEFLADMEGYLFSETTSGSAVSEYRRHLQAVYVKRLCDLFAAETVQNPIRPYVLKALNDLQKRLNAARTSDDLTSAHYASLVDGIARTLVVK